MINNSECKDAQVIAESFNVYFTNIGPTLAEKIPQTPKSFDTFMPHPPPCSFGLLPTSHAEIIQVSSLLKNSSSAGVDDINPSIARSSISLVATPLSWIINCSFNLGLVSDSLKIAKIIPIFKLGVSNLITNYRPISVLPYFSKILEKLMAIRLTTYLDKFALLSPVQFGFQRDLSTYVALTDMQTSIRDAMNSNKYSLGVFFDISKAFDTVNHALLLNKLEYHGIRGVAKQWFVDYLRNRSQFVSFKGITSPSLEITSGVPRGSILGPILFLIYLNDLSKVSNKLKLIMYADDTNAFLLHNSLDVLFDTMNSELCKIVEWFNINKLSLNSDKTNYILFRTPRKKIIVKNLYVNDTPLIQTRATKFLGVIIDQHLSWKDYVALISKKISKNIGIIDRIKYCLSTQNLFNLYYTLIFPYLSYCNIVWGCNYKSSLNRLYTLSPCAVNSSSSSDCLTNLSQLFFSCRKIP